MDPKAVLALAKEKGVKVVDIKFIDMPGTWQHFSVPVGEFEESIFTDGIGFDGSSIRGFQQIHESDMLLFPDPNTAIVDPVCKIPTLSIICNVRDPITLESYSRDPRYVAQKAEKHLLESGLADTSYWGPELEFFIFNDVRYGQNSNSAFYQVDSIEGIWNSGREEVGGNKGFKVRHKEGYFPVPPTDQLQDFRSEIMLKLIEAGIKVEVQHHEVASAGQAEIDMRFGGLVEMADKVMLYKYIVKNMCVDNGFTATFMPKPLFQDNGSGMHTHQSLWKNGKNLFFEPGKYAGLSDMARWYVGGILAHAPSVLGFAAPTTNSYRRLVPGYEAPINLVYSQRNRSACVRIPVYSKSEKAKRIEFRSPDPSCNPYLAFAAMLMAGLDGVRNKIEPPAPIDRDIYELSAEEAANIRTVPGSLEEALAALKADQDYLKVGGVFTQDLIDTWIEYKQLKEADQIHLRPHPWEFHLYYDV